MIHTISLTVQRQSLPMRDEPEDEVSLQCKFESLPEPPTPGVALPFPVPPGSGPNWELSNRDFRFGPATRPAYTQSASFDPSGLILRAGFFLFGCSSRLSNAQFSPAAKTRNREASYFQRIPQAPLRASLSGRIISPADPPLFTRSPAHRSAGPCSRTTAASDGSRPASASSTAHA